jgi:hypothetical protein
MRVFETVDSIALKGQNSVQARTLKLIYFVFFLFGKQKQCGLPLKTF